MKRRVFQHNRTHWRAAVYHLARCLYKVHTYGWPSLSLNSSYSRPTDSLTPMVRGGFEFCTYMPIDGILREVRTIITTLEYERALAMLSDLEISELTSFFRRAPANHDVMPELERARYQKTQQAFERLLINLITTGAVCSRLQFVKPKPV